MTEPISDTNQPQSSTLPALEILVGNIASGKSTWTGTRAAQGWLTIENDSLLRSLHGGRYCWDEQLPGLLETLTREIITACATKCRSVVVDSTNRTRARRSSLIRLGRELGMRVRIVVFPENPAEVHAERRIQSDPRGCSREYWLGVARMMELEFEPPEKDEADDVIWLQSDWFGESGGQI